MRQVIGVGESILDVVFQDNLPYKATPGGSVFNTMVSLSRLGVTSCFMSETGKDPIGKIIRKFMADNGLSTNYLNQFNDGKTAISLAFISEKNETERLSYSQYPKNRFDLRYPQINKNDILIFGSFFALNPILRPAITEVLEYAKERQAIVYYDLNMRKSHAHEAIHVRSTVMDNYESANIVRASVKDFINMYGRNNAEETYKEEVSFYCKNLIVTDADKGVDLFTKTFQSHYAVKALHPVSLIGVGDAFDAGIIYSLIKNDIKYEDIQNLSQEMWSKIIGCGIDLASEVCENSENYISKEFANSYLKK